MESNRIGREDPTGAQASLNAIAADRRQLAVRAKAPGWMYPILGLSTAGIVASPVIADPVWMLILIAGACAVVVALEYAYKKQTGLSTNRVPGPRSLLILIGMGAVVLAMLSASSLVTTIDQPAWVIATAAIGFLTMFPGGLLYDRIYAAELQRGL